MLPATYFRAHVNVTSHQTRVARMPFASALWLMYTFPTILFSQATERLCPFHPV